MPYHEMSKPYALSGAEQEVIACKEFLLFALALVTAPITLPIAGICWVGYKLFDYNKQTRNSKLSAEIERTLVFADTVWKNDNIIIGWRHVNTNFVVIDSTMFRSLEHVVINQIESNWMPDNSFVFIIVDPESLKASDVMKYMEDLTQGKNTVSIYKATTTKIINIENHIIQLHDGYYGIVQNRFNVQYLSI